MNMKIRTFSQLLTLLLLVAGCKPTQKTGQTLYYNLESDIKKQIPDFNVERTDKGIRLALNTDVLFDLDRFEIRQQVRRDLDNLAGILQKYPDIRTEIRGYTDNMGTDTHNMILSEDRAKAIQSYLEARGVPSSHLSAKGYGESSPRYPNDNEADRARNRRVEFYIS